MLRWLESLLWLVAAAAIAVYAGSWTERWVFQTYLNWKFAEELSLPNPLSPGRVRVPHFAQLHGRIDIPSIGLSEMFTDGVDNTTLRRAIGHIPGTARPGQTGNVGLS